MKKTTTIVKTLLYRMCVVTGATALCSGIPNAADASQTVRELFDNLPNNLLASDGTTIDGMTNDATSIGLSTGFWTNNPPGSTGIGYKGSFSVNWVLQGLQGNILPDSAAGANGCLDQYSGNLGTLIDPNTGNPYGVYSPQIYATHPLDPSAYVNFQAAGTNWFSVRVVKNYSWSAGDSSMGVGLSTGNGTNDHFIGFGATRPGAVAADGSTDIGDTDYATQGTLGQAGLPNEADTGGPYLPRATGPAQLFNSGAGAVNWAEAGLLVGRLVTTPSGASELDVVTILPNASSATYILDPGTIVWDATWTFTETNVMTQLLVWLHGPEVEYDAIRVGTSYADVVGLETIGAPVASPGSTVYAGTTVTVSENAQVNSGNTPMWYQWLSNSVPLDTVANPSAASAALVLSNTTTAYTANYNVIVSNYFGISTSAVTQVTVKPAVPPLFTQKPSPTTRYLSSPSATFTAYVDGTPPYTYQWMHAGTNIQSAVTTAVQSNTLSLPPVTVPDAGGYSVTVTNAFGTTNSGAAPLTVIVPPAGSFAAAVTALSPWGYWRLDDNVTAANPVIYDQWGNNNGAVVDVTAPAYGAVAAPYIGFPVPHQGITIQTYTTPSAVCRVNLPKLPVWTNQMTIAFWVTNGAAQMCTMNGYGNGYGLYNNNGELIFEWASLGAPSGGGGMDTGLSVPKNGWTFVALVVAPTQASVFVGNNNSQLVSSTLGGLSLPTSDTAGDTAALYPPGLGRMEWPYDEDGGGNPWNTMTGTWSDVAIFNQSLTSQQVTNLYLSGVGMAIYAAPDGLGNLNMSWNPTFTLQEATSVAGPYTDVGGSPTPPYSLPLPTTTTQHFYRLRQ